MNRPRKVPNLPLMTETGHGTAVEDVAVIEALRRGDEEAFTRLVQQHHRALQRIARLYVSSPATAEEVVQDTWLAVIRGIWAFEGRSSLRTWILRILINRSKTRAVREGRSVPFSDGVAADREETLEADRETREVVVENAPAGEVPAPASLHDPGPSPEEAFLTEEARARLRGAIETLPPNQRLVITMRDLEGCSSEEVRNVLGLTETNQRVILHRARLGVRARLTAAPRKG